MPKKKGKKGKKGPKSKEQEAAMAKVVKKMENPHWVSSLLKGFLARQELIQCIDKIMINSSE